MGNLCSTPSTKEYEVPQATGAQQVAPLVFEAQAPAVDFKIPAPAAPPPPPAKSSSDESAATATVTASQDNSHTPCPKKAQDVVVHDTDIDVLGKSPSFANSTKPKQLSKLRTDVKLRDVYKLAKTLGTGGFSVVKLAVDRMTGKEYACKIMALPPVGQEVGENENTRDDIFKEIDLLCGMNHDNVIYLKEFFEEGNKVYLITELLTGGELLEAVLKRGSYTEREARICMVQVLRGIEYLHSKNVVHRDLKLENLLLAHPDDIRCVKIADFGLAKNSSHGMQTICGTPQYVAPEVIVGQKGHVYGPGVDMWSAGVVLYILLGGYPPFWSESEPQLFDQIRKGRYSFGDPVWNKAGETAKDLIRKLLVVDPKKRLNATDALKHIWFQEGNNDGLKHGPVPLPVPAQADVPVQAAQVQVPAVLTSTPKARTNRFKVAVLTVVAARRIIHIYDLVRNGKRPHGVLANDVDLHRHMVLLAEVFDDSDKLKTESGNAVVTP